MMDSDSDYEPDVYVGFDDDDEDVDVDDDDYMSELLQLRQQKAEEESKERENLQLAQQKLLTSVCYNADEVSRAMGTLYDDQRYSDVTLVVGERRYNAHRLVLSAWSDVFKTMLCDSSWQPHGNHSGPDIIEQTTSQCQNLVEEECCEVVFGDFLKFFYTASVDLTKHNVVPLALLADKYLVKEMRELCDEFIRDLQNDVKEVVSFIHLASQFGMRETVELCLQCLLSNFSVLTPEQVLSLESEHLISLLDSGPKLIVDDEYTLFKKIEPWLDQCQSGDTLLSVIKLIRFPYMNALQLKKVRETPAFSRAQEMMPDLLLKCWQQQALYQEDSLKDLPKDFPWPRLYLDSNDATRFKDQKVGSHHVHVENEPKEVFIDGVRCHHSCAPWKGKQVEERLIFKRSSDFRFSVKASQSPSSSGDVIVQIDTDEVSTRRLHLGVRVQVHGGKLFYFSKCLPPALLQAQPVVHHVSRTGRRRRIVGNSTRVTRDVQFAFPSGISNPKKCSLHAAVILEDEDEETT